MELVYKKSNAAPSKSESIRSENENWMKDLNVWNNEVQELKEYLLLASLAVQNHTKMYARHKNRILLQRGFVHTEFPNIPDYGYNDGLNTVFKKDNTQEIKEHSDIGKMHKELKKYHVNIQTLTNALKHSFKK